jgi:putative transcriptional regulator
MSDKRNLAKEALDGMREALQHARGDRELSISEIHLESEEIRATRAQLGMTQKEFADLFGVNLHTLRNWEQGRRRPEGPARVLLRIIEKEPQAVFRALHAED